MCRQSNESQCHFFFQFSCCLGFMEFYFRRVGGGVGMFCLSGGFVAYPV